MLTVDLELSFFLRVCGLIVNQEDMPFTDLVGISHFNDLLLLFFSFFFSNGFLFSLVVLRVSVLTL